MNLKINIPFSVISESIRHWESVGEFPGQLLYLKVIDLDQYSVYGGWYTQVNDRFQEYKTF